MTLAALCVFVLCASVCATRGLRTQQPTIDGELWSGVSYSLRAASAWATQARSLQTAAATPSSIASYRAANSTELIQLAALQDTDHADIYLSADRACVLGLSYETRAQDSGSAAQRLQASVHTSTSCCALHQKPYE